MILNVIFSANHSVNKSIELEINGKTFKTTNKQKKKEKKEIQRMLLLLTRDNKLNKMSMSFLTCQKTFKRIL